MKHPIGTTTRWCRCGIVFLFTASAVSARPASADTMQVPLRRDTFALVQTSAAARMLADWIFARADNQGLPMIIVDKTAAQVFAIDPAGRLVGSAPALLGLAVGDKSPPDIGNRKLAAIPPKDRITPAGRFVAALGQNLGGKTVLWVDYDAVLSLHPVITTNPAEHRLDRLATPTAADNRISYGCINVPASFFNLVVQPLFSHGGGVVYILPEVRSIKSVFETGSAAPANRASLANAGQSTGTSDQKR